MKKKVIKKWYKFWMRNFKLETNYVIFGQSVRPKDKVGQCFGT